MFQLKNLYKNQSKYRIAFFHAVNIYLYYCLMVIFANKLAQSSLSGVAWCSNEASGTMESLPLTVLGA